MELRDYQLAAVEAIAKQFESASSTLLVAPTGIGKTVIFAEVIRRNAEAGNGRAIVLAHVGELLDQAAGKLRDIGISVDVEKAWRRADQAWWKAPVILTSRQTQMAGRNGYRRMMRFNPAEFSLLVVDEAHHAAATSYREILAYYRKNPDLKVLGVTATPNRADEQALGQIFETVAYEIPLLGCIDDGWLVDVKRAAPVIQDYDLSECKTSKGDFKPSELAAVMEDERVIYEMAAVTREIAGDRRTLVFCVRVEQAKRFAEILNRLAPGSARYVCGATPDEERTILMRDYRDGRFQYLTNVGVATEGFDVPQIACVAVCRPTKSRPLFQQMMGRGMRPVWDGWSELGSAQERLSCIAVSTKPDLLMIDFCGNFGSHHVITTLDALGGNYDDEAISLAEREHWDDGKVRDVRETLEQAQKLRMERYRERMEREEAEAERRRFIKPKVAFGVTWSKPLRILSLDPPREPGWHKGRKPTSPMIALLDKFRVEDPEELTFVEAHAMIDSLIQRRKQNLCTYRQAKWLRKFGYPASTTFEEAGRILDKKFGNKKRQKG